MRRRISRSTFGLPLAVVILAGCSFVGASEITVDATNNTGQPMVVQVMERLGRDTYPHGSPQIVDPFESRELELTVPGGDWAVFVNGDELLGNLDVGSRRGRLPVTLILSGGSSSWQAPENWAEEGR